jgi:hypothetical protein
VLRSSTVFQSSPLRLRFVALSLLAVSLSNPSNGRRRVTLVAKNLSLFGSRLHGFLIESLRLDTDANADMRSDMKTFTVRELDRSLHRVLNACSTDGKARIRGRNGKSYVITPEASPQTTITGQEIGGDRRPHGT